MLDLFSAASGDSTSDSTEQGSGMSSSANPTSTVDQCSEQGSPEHPSMKTFALSENQRGELLLTDVAHQLTSGGGKQGQGYPAVVQTFNWRETEKLTMDAVETLDTQADFAVLISSAEDSPAKTSASPDDVKDSPVTDPASSSSSHESLELFDPAIYSWKTFQGCSPRTMVGTSESCLQRWPSSGTAWATGFSTAATSECRSDEDGCSSSESSLTEILEPPQDVPGKYSLSARAAQGILRRARKRGRKLPTHLEEALARVAGQTGTLTDVGRL